jgi:plastocyanin
VSRARLVLALVLVLLVGGVTSALAQEATAPETSTEEQTCADEACGTPTAAPEIADAEEPVAETEAEVEAPAPVEAQPVTETVPVEAAEVDAVAGSASAQRSASALALATVTVEVVDFDYEPGSVTIAPGDTIQWNFTGDAPHTVTADDGSFDSGQLNSGENFSMRFDEVGTYRYYCTLHGGAGGEGMSAIVIVEGNGGSEEPPSVDGGNGDEGAAADDPNTGNAQDGALPRTGSSVPPIWVFAVALLFSGLVLWRVARLAGGR